MAWTLACLVVLFAIALAVVAWTLTPVNLTPRLERFINEHTIVDVKIERAELTTWGTFPDATLDITGIVVTSHAFEGLPEEQRRRLPAAADTLMTMRHFHAGLNILKALMGRWQVNDVMLVEPQLNMVALDPAHRNYVLMSYSQLRELKKPHIEMTSLEVMRCHSLRWTNVEKGIEVSLPINAAQIKQRRDRRYQVILDATASLNRGTSALLTDLPVELLGTVAWETDRPYRFAASDWQLRLGSTPLRLNFGFDATDALRLDSLRASVSEFSFTAMRHYVEPRLLGEAARVTTDLRGTIAINLLGPYTVSPFIAPQLDIDIDVPSIYLVTEERHRIDSLALKMHAQLRNDLDTYTVERAFIYANTIGIDLSRRLRETLSDPRLTRAEAIARALQFFYDPEQLLSDHEVEMWRKRQQQYLNEQRRREREEARRAQLAAKRKAQEAARKKLRQSHRR